MDTTQTILGLLTIALSGAVSGIVTFQLNTRRDQQQLKRQKLEALYESFYRYTNQLTAHWLPYISAMSNRISYNDAIDIRIRSETGNENNLQKVEMLTAIYFPNLQKYIDSLINIRDNASNTIQEHKEIYRDKGPHYSPASKKMNSICEELSKLESIFTIAIREEAEKLNKKIPGSN